MFSRREKKQLAIKEGVGKKMFKGALVLFCLTAFLSTLSGQQYYGLGISAGPLLKHRNSINVDQNRLLSSLSFTISNYTDGKADWERYWNRPIIEHKVGFFDFGNSQTLGFGVSYIPSIKIKLAQKKGLKLYIQQGYGIGWVSKKFHPIDNPDNNLIGSNINNSSLFAISVEKKLKTGLIIDSGLSFSHFSNGLNQAPNLGINMVAVDLMIKKSKKSSNKTVEERAVYTGKKNKLAPFFYMGVGRNETGKIPGGPKWIKQYYSLGAQYGFRSYSRVIGGLEVEISGEEKAFKEEQVSNNEEIPFWEYSNLMIYGGQEFLFGRTGFKYQIGTYLEKDSRPYYSRLFLHYFLKNPENNRFQPHIGLMLKSHGIVAEYIAINIGAVFY